MRLNEKRLRRLLFPCISRLFLSDLTIMYKALQCVFFWKQWLANINLMAKVFNFLANRIFIKIYFKPLKLLKCHDANRRAMHYTQRRQHLIRKKVLNK